MAKFDFNNSRYARFFSSKQNTKFLQTFINTEGILHVNYGWWRTQGRKASGATPTAYDGTSTFTVKARSLKAAPLMDLRAPLADSNQMDKEGLKMYTASIPDFIAPGYVETAMEREERIRRFDLFGSDADIVSAWTDNVQTLIDSADTTLNLLTAKLMSTGQISYAGIGRGIQAPLHKAAIPSENFVNAGEKVWTAEDCNILAQMATIEKKFREKWGFQGAMKWQVTYKMFHEVFLANAQVKELVENYKKNPMAWIAQATNAPVTVQLFERAIQDFPGVSPIEIVEEKERNLTNTGDAMIQGWPDDVAVLRPAGDAVEFEYTDILDKQMFEKYGASTITKVWAQTNDGLATLVNTTLNNGVYKEWHTDLMMSAVPALIDFPYHVIVKTSTAG